MLPLSPATLKIAKMEPSVTTHDFSSNEPDKISKFIEKIYETTSFDAPHNEGKGASIKGAQWRGIGIYDVVCEAPFHFQSDQLRSKYLFVSCHRGGARYSLANSAAECTAGDLISISPKGAMACDTSKEGLSSLWVILDAHDLNNSVSRWTGRAKSEPIHFDLKLTSPYVAAQWELAAHCLRRMMLMPSMPYTAANTLYEHMLKLLIEGHGNNLSRDISVSNDLALAEDLARSAIAMIESDPMQWGTLGTIAYALGCPIAELENAIVRLTKRDSRALFFEARLQGVHQRLLRGNHIFSEALAAYGFKPSSRFTHLYTQRFGTSPSATLGQNISIPSAIESGRNDSFCKTSLDSFIDDGLGKPIRLSDLARYLGLSKQATIAAFKAKFSITPMQYVAERRLERARWMLENTQESIQSIALTCGFGRQSYLTTQIKRYYGATPRQLRLLSL